ncbi:MAG: thioredoxin family protein [Bdellovibrionales bacterium]|nr:thioredoxin family protein [Bdellovibrionales bacterium]
MRALMLVCALIVSPLALANSPSKAAAAAPAVLKNGDVAPDFALKGADGKDYKLSQFKGKTVVLEWFNKDCPYVKKFYDSKTMQGLQKEQVAKGTVWLTIISSAAGKEGHLAAADAQKLMTEKGVASTAFLFDDKGSVGKAYSAKTTPHMFVIDKAGKVAYQGAIDDRPSATMKSLEGAQNYVTAALTSLEKGEPVKTASTTPYGCSVKY